MERIEKNKTNSKNVIQSSDSLSIIQNAWETYVEKGIKPESLLRSEILLSWERSMMFGVNPFQKQVNKNVNTNSAGSEPGPTCFDCGGMNPTVTDADLILGYLDPEYYEEGDIELNRRRAEFAIDEELCDELDLYVIEAARQIKKKVDTNMAYEIFKELGVKGYDPKNFTLLAYGGNGPLHCCGIAKVLEIEKILIPPFSPIFQQLELGS